MAMRNIPGHVLLEITAKPELQFPEHAPVAEQPPAWTAQLALHTATTVI